MQEYIETFQGVIVPAPVLLKLENKKTYGTVPDLDDEELADPDELERHVLKEEYGPILLLPIKAKRSWLQPVVDETGGLDYGAFGTVDFLRTLPEFNVSRYKEDKLKEKLSDVLILFCIVSERIKSNAKYLVLKYLRMGIIDFEHIVEEDMLALGKLYMRARRIQREMTELRKAALNRSKRRLKVFLKS